MADGQMLRVIVYDYQDSYVCDIDPTQIVELTSTEEVNGERALDIRTTQELGKTDRIVIRDGMGLWHEYVVTGIGGEHGGRKVGAVVHDYHAVWSLQYDLSATYIDTQVGLVPGHPSVPSPALEGLRAALSGTKRWKVGTITVTSTGSASFYRRSGWEGLKTLTENWGGEISARIEVGRDGVVSRLVDFLAHEGNEAATRRFDYGGDVSKIKRTVSDDVWPCRIVPLGKASETDVGGYSRRPTIADANDGVVWVEDPDAVPLTRVPDGEGGWEYPTTIVKNDVYSDPAQLKAWAIEHVSEYARPKVTYEADVVQLVKAGMNPHGVALGDNVVVVDRAFGDGGLAIDARVIKIVQSLIDSTDVRLTIGNAKTTLSTALGGLSRDMERMSEQQVIAAAYQSTAAYVSNLISRLNDEINATGGYWYAVPGIGSRTYDVEVSDPAVGAEASKVVEMRGGNIRIADSRTSSGEWDWRTVFQSGHILSELVTAAQLTAGFIGSADSGNFWDLDSGEFRMASTARLGDKTVQDVLDGVSDTITGVDVEFAQGTSPTVAPTSGWQTQAPTWEAGKYIWQRTATTTPDGTAYSDPVMVSGKDGTDGTSVTILGSYNTLAELEAAHPTGNDGDAYMVGGDLYVWNGSAWEDVGQIRGPQGPAGTSVTVTSIEYGTSASAGTQPSSWSTTAPTSIAKGRWLWVRTSYSNGSAATTKSYVGTDGEDGTSVYVQSSSKADGVTTVVLASTDGTTTTIRIADGEDGATGQRGPAGENGESTYIHTAWANSADGVTDFSTTESAGKSYLGVCTDQTEPDPTTPSSYSWSRIEGEAGADGTGVSGLKEQYYLSTSSGSPTGGAWQDSPPAFVTGRFYFTRTVTTYTDGTAVISDPTLARGLNSANKNASDALTKANSVGSDLTDLKTQEAIFNLLTNNGALQGLYMKDGQLYVNATYVLGGTIAGELIQAIGAASGWQILIDGDSIDMVRGSDTLLHLGYGSVSSGTSTTNSVYYTLGTRKASEKIGRFSIVTGNNCAATNTYSHAEGNGTTASGTYSHAEGNGATASGSASHAEGSGATASGNHSHAEGYKTTAQGTFSHAEGYMTTASGQYAHTEGSKATAEGNYSHAEGDQTTASGPQSHAEGQLTTAKGTGSHAEGYSTKAIEQYAHAEGRSTEASGDSSHAEGSGTKASKQYAHAEGSGTTASGSGSHAEGLSATASGAASHAEGMTTTASGTNSHAEGRGTEASGTQSHAGGMGTIAAGTNQMAVGKYNVSDTTSMFIVGGGTSSTRKSAMTVTAGGNVTITGKLTQSSDRRLKEHHEYLGEDACDFVRSLRPALYTKDGERQLGFYAQDVRDAEPEGWDTATVTEQHNYEGMGFDPLTLDYTALIAPTVAYAQALEGRVKALEERLALLEKGHSS